MECVYMGSEDEKQANRVNWLVNISIKDIFAAFHGFLPS